MGEQRPSGWLKIRLGQALTDQLLWSGAFFAFNLIITLRLTSEELTDVATAIAISLVALSIVRAIAVDASVIDSRGTSADHALAARIYVFGGVVALTATSFVSSYIGDWDAQGCLLAFFLLTADFSRYVHVATGQLRLALRASVTYFAVATAVAVSAHALTGQTILLTWLCVLIALSSSTFVAATRSVLRSGGLRLRASLGVEGGALMTSSQLPLLMYGLAGDEVTVTALRVAYSVVFSVPSLIIQSVNPLVARRTHRSDLETVRKRISRVFVIVTCVLFVSAAAIFSVLTSEIVSIPVSERVASADFIVVPLLVHFCAGAILAGSALPLRVSTSPVLLGLKRVLVLVFEVAVASAALLLSWSPEMTLILLAGVRVLSICIYRPASR